MDCSCGAYFQTTSDDMDSVEAKKRYPNRKVPEGWAKITVVTGICKCSRFHFTMHLNEKLESNKSNALW